VVTSR